MANKKQNTKTVRLDLHFNENNEISYKDFCSKAFETQRNIRKAKNKLSCLLYFDLLKEHEMGCDSVKKRNECYKLIEPILWESFSGNRSAVAEKVFQAYNGGSRGKEILKGMSSAPSYGANQPIELRNDAIIACFEDGKRVLRIKFFSDKAKKALGLKSNEIVFQVVKTRGYQNAIFDRCISKEYKVAGSSLSFEKNRWVIHLGYSFVPDDTDLDPTKILGVDLGEAKPFCVATDTGWDRKFANGNKIRNFRNATEQRRNQLKSDATYNSGGHGRKKRMALADKVGHKVENFRNTTNFQYAKAIVDFAIQQNCGTIQMEDLRGISKDNKFLKGWTYFDLQTKIENKAKEYGILVRKIDPQYTSQRCHKCGWIDHDSRKSQSEFVCTKCGHRDNADCNAARNIAMSGIEKIIKAQCKLQGLRYKEKGGDICA